MGKFNIGDRVLFTPGFGESDDVTTYHGTITRIGAHEDGIRPDTEYGVLIDDEELPDDVRFVIEFAAAVMDKDLTAHDAYEKELEHA